MLNRWKERGSAHLQAAMESLQCLGMKPLSTMMTVLVLAVVLTIPAVLWVMTAAFTHIAHDWQRGAHISVYLKSSLATEEAQQLLNTVRTDPGVAQADFIIPEVATTSLPKSKSSPNEPPSASTSLVMDVQPSEEVDSDLALDQLAGRLRTYAQVEQVQVDMAWIQNLRVILGTVEQWTQWGMFFLGLVICLIISNTLRLLMQHRQDSIQVLQLLGASNAYITRPFLYFGIWYGFASSLLAIVLVSVFLYSASIGLDALAASYHLHVPLLKLSVLQGYGLVCIAMLLGWSAAKVSVLGLVKK
ncbi:MAG: cell division protein [Legionellaceae bacterium]|nr:cell division protein [Legionellaceae bacterium]